MTGGLLIPAHALGHAIRSCPGSLREVARGATARFSQTVATVYSLRRIVTLVLSVVALSVAARPLSSQPASGTSREPTRPVALSAHDAVRSHSAVHAGSTGCGVCHALDALRPANAACRETRLIVPAMLVD